MSKKLKSAAIALLALMFVGVLFVVAAKDALYENPNFDSSAPVDLTQWEYTSPDAPHTPQAVTLPRTFTYNPAMPTLTLFTTLAPNNSINTDPCVLVPNVYCNVDVFLDGELLFEDHAPAGGFGATSGARYNLVSLPNDWAGRQLTLAYTPLLQDNLSYGITAPVIGDKEGIVLAQFMLDAPTLAIGAIMMVLGAGLVVLHLATRRTVREGNDLGFIGLFALVCGAYMLCQLTTTHLFQKNSFAVYVSEFYLFMLLPVVLAALLGHGTKRSTARAYHVVFWIAALNCAAQTVLAFGFGVELRVMLPVTQLIIVGLAAVLAVTFGVSIARKRLAHDLAKRRLLISVTPLMVGGIVDLVLSYVVVRDVPTLFFKLGMVAFVCLEAYFSYRDYLAWRREKIVQQTYRTLAFTDALTGLGNRAAFERDLARAEEGLVAGERPVCVSVDIDNLKTVNDTKGHAAGDELIRTVARALQDFAGALGTVYRMGGDEFVVLFGGLDEQSAATRAHDLAALSAPQPNTHAPSFSVGYARFDPILDPSFEKTLARADAAMYASKRERKAAAAGEGSGDSTPKVSCLAKSE